MTPYQIANKLLLLLAVLCFVLAWYGIKIAGGDTGMLGLAFFSASFLLP